MVRQEVLEFWFAEETRPFWWKKSEAFDDQVRSRFLGTWEAARTGAHDDWAETPEGAVALVVTVDQFPRNMFRGDPRSWASDEKGLAVATAAVEAGFDERLPTDAHRQFLYMPFMHAESLAAQERCCELFDRDGVRGNLKWAVAHRDIVARFGRFPHRNEILGRESTAEELAFLQTPGSSF